MWQRIPLRELAFDRRQRKKKAIYIFLALIMFSVYLILNRYSDLEEIAVDFKANPEGVGLLLLLPLFLWVFFRGYVDHGHLGWTSQRVCIGCGRTWGHSNDGWGFMSFGKNKAKWYQIKVCETPDKCDIAGRHEVIWIPDDDTHNK